MSLSPLNIADYDSDGSDVIVYMRRSPPGADGDGEDDYVTITRSNSPLTNVPGQGILPQASTHSLIAPIADLTIASPPPAVAVRSPNTPAAPSTSCAKQQKQKKVKVKLAQPAMGQTNNASEARERAAMLTAQAKMLRKTADAAAQSAASAAKLAKQSAAPEEQETARTSAALAQQARAIAKRATRRAQRARRRARKLAKTAPAPVVLLNPSPTSGSHVAEDKAARKAAKRAAKRAVKRAAKEAQGHVNGHPQGEVITATKFTSYIQAQKFVSAYIAAPDKTKSVELSFLHALLIEFGLHVPLTRAPPAYLPPSPAPTDDGTSTYSTAVNSPESAIISLPMLPTTLSAARRELKAHVFVNILDYIHERVHGLDALRAVMKPSRKALLRSLAKKKSRAPLQLVKASGLNVLLVSCFHN